MWAPIRDPWARSIQNDASDAIVSLMVYPGEFVRLVMIGTLYADVFNTTLSIVPSALGEIDIPAPDAATLEAISEDVAAWWTLGEASGGPGFINAARLTSIKLNRINAAGHYTEAETNEWTYPSPIPGTSSGTLAPQLSVAATLRTAIPRGRGSKGRMFLPPTSRIVALGSDGRMSVANAAAQATSVKNLITSLNATYTLIGRVGVASNVGLGRFEHVTEVSVGRVVDTIRSRRSALEEDYQSVTV